MRTRRNDTCPCGSGRKFKRCCGDDSVRERESARVDLGNAAAFLPSLRPYGAEVLELARRAAVELGENDGSVPAAVVERALAVLADDDRRAVVAHFAEAEPDVWERAVRALGDDESARDVVASAIRGAVCDRRPVSRVHLVVLEHAEPLPRTVPGRLGLVLPSGAVWTIADAEWLLREYGLHTSWTRWVEEQEPAMLERVDEWQIERVRLLCEATRRALPIPSLPRASGILRRDCRQVARDDAAALLLSHAAMVAAAGMPMHSLN